jgi:hypothetical protein
MEVPFACSITGFPFARSRKVKTFKDAGNVVGCHVSGWLPDFPVPTTHINPSVTNKSSVPANIKKGSPFSYGSVSSSFGF